MSSSVFKRLLILASISIESSNIPCVSTKDFLICSNSFLKAGRFSFFLNSALANILCISFLRS
jgi:hypothetical protein